MYWDKRVTKLCKKYPLHLKYVLALPWEIWDDRFNPRRSTYMYIFINHRIATNTSGSHCLKIVKCVESNVIFTLHACNVRLRCREIVKTHQKRVNSLNHALLNVRLASWRQRLRLYVLAFVLETDISSMRCRDDVTYYTFDDFRDNNCRWFCSYSIIH